MSETSSILELPIDPTGGGNNIVLTANENNSKSQAPMTPMTAPMSLDESTINQIISGLQQASASSLTQLPSRDIPKNTDTIMQDVQTQPNYIPKEQTLDYIKNQENSEDILSAYNKKVKKTDTFNDSLNDMYNEIQTPILLAVLYFLFQLPILKKTLFTYIPSLFSKDGNYNINGFFFISILFGFVFYKFNKLSDSFSKDENNINGFLFISVLLGFVCYKFNNLSFFNIF
jgi:hypothetical protein